MRQRPVLIVNPRHDVEFVALVEQLVDHEPTSVGRLQAALRERHPRASVHLREISGEPDVVWYVYRDGRWIPPSDATRG